MIKIEEEYWINYYAEGCEYFNLNSEEIGKWMYYYSGEDGYKFAEAVCKDCVELGIVLRAKHSPKSEERGVVCFYLTCDDIQRHKKLISYFIDNNMIRKTKAGKFYDISFKFNTQTILEQYGQDYVPTIKLSDFIDLNTGKWIK